MDKKILYIQSSKKLPWSYFILASGLNLHGVTVIPVSWQQFLSLLPDYPQLNVVLFTSNYLEKTLFLNRYQPILNKLVHCSRINLLHFNSFSQCQLFYPHSNRLYRHWLLPLEIQEIVPDLMQQLNQAQQLQEKKQWWG